MGETVNLDGKIAEVRVSVVFSALEAEHWPGGVEAMLLAKTENAQQRLMEAMRDEAVKRGWIK